VLCLLDIRTVALRSPAVLGVRALNMLGLVSLWHRPGSTQVLVCWRWWKPSGSGQALIEFALVFALIGIALSLTWSLISSLAASHQVSISWWLVHLVYGGGLDWMFTGIVP
jgi:hypothetical protein